MSDASDAPATSPSLQPLRFIFHIGAGKTGTSSIQSTLRSAIPALAREGVWYLGLVLEHAPVKLYPWQEFGATARLHALPLLDGQAQIRDVLMATVSKARSEGISTLIWSSESFFDRPEKAIQPLIELVHDNVDVMIVAYLRNHVDWLRSAYLQWGIKHKTKAGPILPFKAWKNSRKSTFHRKLLVYLNAFPGKVCLRNIDSIGDAVADFLNVVGIAALCKNRLRENSTGGDVDTLLRACFNNDFDQPVFPIVFDKAVGRLVNLNESVDGYVASLMWNESDLMALMGACAQDRDAVNTMLRAQGQAALHDGMHGIGDYPKVPFDQLLLALAALAVHQDSQIVALEHALASGR